MLLSPALASTWAPRLKCIILDEIHCIGQSEDGIIWEQLVLLAPCPIIALSATVGNPKEFHQWLQITQNVSKLSAAKKKDKTTGGGRDVVMVHHEHRFNDLRKFYYQPGEDEDVVYDTLTVKDHPFPGLENTSSATKLGGVASLDENPNLRFLHPVAALGQAVRGIPGDLSLEPRDCFMLWEAMCKFQTPTHPVPDHLNPMKGKWFPDIIKKEHVIVWELALKKLLSEWIQERNPAYTKIVRYLRDNVQQSVETPQLAIEQEVKPTVEDTELVITDKIPRRIIWDRVPETLGLLNKLHQLDALPAILFIYDRRVCNLLALKLVQQLEAGEAHYRENSKEWKRKVEVFKAWEAAKKKKKDVKKPAPLKKGQEKVDEGPGGDEEDEGLSVDFDPEAPSERFSFVNRKANYLKAEKDEDLRKLLKAEIGEGFLKALDRGIGVHHSGLDRTYREQ